MHKTLFLLPLLLVSTLAFSNPASAEECGSDHPMVNNCTLRVDHFNYDGKGVDVRFGFADNARFKKFKALTKGLHGKGAFANASMTLKLEHGMSLDQVKFVSFWCVAFRTSFADGELKPAMAHKMK
jgi:hypothetical protein